MDDGKSEHVRSGVGEAKSEKRVVQGHIRVFLLYSTSRHSNSTRPCVVIVAPTVDAIHNFREECKRRAWMKEK